MSTIYDVAKAAGVSPKTVSRVLNGGDRVRESTVAAVTAAMTKLDYVPSSAARTMRSNRSGLIGVVTNVLAGGYERPDQVGLPDLLLVQAIQQRLEPTGMTLLMADSGGKAKRVSKLLQTFAEHRVEGVLYVAPSHQKVRLPKTTGIKHTVIVNGFDNDKTLSVIPDDYTGQRKLIEQLIAAGHQRIAYLTLPTTLIATTERTRAWQDALDAAGINPKPDWLRAGDPAAPSEGTGKQLQANAIDHFLSLAEPPTVICTGNDRMAMHVYGLLRSRGLKVPEDISVTGYDDHRLISETLYPQLTTMELPYHRMGEAAADLLSELIDGHTPTHTAPILIKGSLRWRDSVSTHAPSFQPLDSTTQTTENTRERSTSPQ
ncbi:MAG: LacI family DNA-binding transcriptional regulator [Granulosicoccus sp.]